ncbi:glycoside hydrolase family 30 [Paenibacillus curdlanolyticus YK9]|uniref:Glycoside hydrolase family 30 n=1 Tax=Paenibacillus curdlanolyticus YK9 TaxID=717606 RepID=E0IAR3_9BACL|nr:glycoside hydrolase [Paenibacillus curdlanolyticus]EFM10467.1 glycoside hydrolase family 30 [Paenibacillus curdlanolyticus YK9]
MKARIARKRWLAAPLALALLLQSPIMPKAHAATSTVTIYKSTTYQAIWGFGASANHPVNELKTNYSAGVQAEILDKLFRSDDTNAGLSIVRLEINPYTSAQDAVQRTFMPADGVYDWNTDGHQRWFAQEAENRGMNQFYAVPWSPPGWMKDNGSPNNGGHLLPGNYDKFANYLKSYVDYYRNTLGFNIKWVSVQNEPDLATPYASAQYTNQEMDTVLAKAADAIHSLNQGVLVGAPEGSNRTASNNYMVNLSEATRNKLDFVSVHDYGAYTDVNHFGKPTLSTEVCDFQNPNDPTITDGLKWANMIAADLKRGERGWLYWWAVNPASNTTGEGLINLQPNDTYAVNKRLYALGQFSRYLRPGDTRVLASSSDSNLISVAGTNATGRASVVIINNSSSAITTTLSGLTMAKLSGRRTSATESLAKLADLTVTSGSVQVTLPGKSITSFSEF